MYLVFPHMLISRTGAVTCIFIGNALGRRRTIFLGTCIMVVGAILQTTSYQLPQFIIGRIVTGFGNGLNTSTVPTWQSECSRSHRRGQLVMIEGALITCGVMIAYWVWIFLEYGLHRGILKPARQSHRPQPSLKRRALTLHEALHLSSFSISSDLALLLRFWHLFCFRFANNSQVDFGLYFTDPSPVSWRFPVSCMTFTFSFPC